MLLDFERAKIERILVYELILFLSSIAAGFIGTLLGLGGGIIVVPVLTLFLEIDIRYAIAASLLSVITTSSSGAANFLKEGLANLRIATFLEVGTVFGAITGFFIASSINASFLYFLFAGFLIFSMVMMYRQREDIISEYNHPWSERLNLSGLYTDRAGVMIDYKVDKADLSLFFMYIAGILSAILGIGSGILKVIAMDNAMKLPMKVSTATSNFMIGVTAVASAGAYFIKGDIRPPIVIPVALGVIIGSWLGARAVKKVPSSAIRIIFIILMFFVSLQMIYKGYTS